MTDTQSPSLEDVRREVAAMRQAGKSRAEIAGYAYEAGFTVSAIDAIESLLPFALEYSNYRWHSVFTLQKKPVGGAGWQKHATSDPEKLRKLSKKKHDGVGVLVGQKSGIIDFDCDGPGAEDTLQMIFDGAIPRTTSYQSTRGRHLIFAYTTGLPRPDTVKFNVGSGGLEIRTGYGTGSAQTVLPPSGGRVWIVPPNECMPAAIPPDAIERIKAMVPEQQSTAGQLAAAPTGTNLTNQLERARAWIAKAESAIAGQGGSNKALSVAINLRAFGLESDQMFELMSGEWNASCVPPWSDQELRHKIDSAIKINPQPKEDRGRHDGGSTRSSSGSRTATPNESPDDPHRLARLFLKHNFTRVDGLQTLVWWQASYWYWDGLRWNELKKHELIAQLTACVKAELDRVNLSELENWEPKSDEDKPPKVRPVTKSLLNNIDNAVASIVSQPDHVRMPDWLCGDPPFPAREVLATTKSLIHLASLIAGKSAGRIDPTPMLFSCNALHYDYDPKATYPNWMAFLNSIWGNDSDSIISLMEWFGYLLLPDTRQHKLLMMIGPRRSGKGTITRVLHALLGEGNVASPTLSSLSGPFGLWPLLNKFVALIPDARLSGRDDSIAIVERLLSITGEDPQDVHRKNLPTLTGVRMPIRFVLMSNELPNLKDASGAFMSRVHLLRMTESFLGREDKFLEKRLLQELPGILNWAIEGWERINHRGYFEQPASANDMIADLENLSSPIKQFIADACHVGGELEASTETLYSAWKSWCETNHHDHTGTAQAFGKNLRAALPKLEGGQRRDENSRIRIYRGIGVRVDW